MTAMIYFLAKTDPGVYSITDLEKEKITSWSGVRNPQAVKALKSMKKGDRVLIYHSEGQAAIVGVADVVGNSRPDPKDEKSWLVDFKFVRKFSEPFINLKMIKQAGMFKDFALVRQGRLSTMQVPNTFIVWLKKQRLKV